MEEFYMDIVMNLMYDIQLRIEGAIVLFEDDATPLRRLALENDRKQAYAALHTSTSRISKP